MNHKNLLGIPDFSSFEFQPKNNKYCLCIPIINESERIKLELTTAKNNAIHQLVDIIICDGGSTDGSTEHKKLIDLGVNTLLIKEGPGKQGAVYLIASLRASAKQSFSLFLLYLVML